MQGREKETNVYGLLLYLLTKIQNVRVPSSKAVILLWLCVRIISEYFEIRIPRFSLLPSQLN